MLNVIDCQLCSDEQTQQTNEAQLAPQLLSRQKRNLEAWLQFDKTLAEQINSHHLVTFSPFVNCQKQASVLDIHLGRSLYPLDPIRESAKQVADFCRAALKVNKREDYAPIVATQENGAGILDIFPGIEHRYRPILQSESEQLVILGCGLGYHLLELASSAPWQSILLVEPALDLLKVSLLSAPWEEFFDYCSAHHISVTIQTGLQGNENLLPIEKWLERSTGESFHLFRHYQYPLFAKIELDLALGRLAWHNLTSLASQQLEQERVCEFGFSINHYFTHARSIEQNLLTQNLSAFEQYLPDINASFCSYQPKRWWLFQNQHQQWNLLDIELGVTLYLEDAKSESLAYLEHYARRPKLDVLDARKGTRKDSPYIHYKFSDQLKELVQSLPNEQFHKLPQKLPSFIMYGLGIGYALEKLALEHEVDNLIVYEPNSDYFYASLLLTDWQPILARLDKLEANLYLNVGDNGENMVEDILNRLNYSGIHILSYTFFYVSYFQSQFDQHIRHTREHFKVLLNISEYYDHAFYNWTHTRQSLLDNEPYLLKQRSNTLNKQLEELPVFIVGNGPSLDSCIDTLREYQDRAIIISCGTSLKALYKYGIRPDFHAEVEQTRSTYHWIRQVQDNQWLAQIDLLTVNGVHPDVSSLFHQTLLCFKRGEAATLAHLLANPDADKYQDILYSYPTVSNCAIAYALALGFKQLYLFGVDLGFKDPRYHHSQQSAYFKEQDGSEIYDYAQHGVGLRVKGNFDEFVFTKYEFRYSAEIIEKTLALYSNVDCYNTSDGAYINGTIALPPEQVLILNSSIDKAAFRQLLLNDAYDTHTTNLAKLLDDWFNDSHFVFYIEQMQKILRQECHGWQDILEQQMQQMAVLGQGAANSHSLFFVLMRGSVNFCLTYLTRLAFSCEDETVCLERYEQGKAIWQNYLTAIAEHFENSLGEFDQTPGLDF